MIDVSQVAGLLPVLGVAVGVLAALMQFRNLNVTRRAEIWMHLYETFRSKEFARDYCEILYHHSWKNFDDWSEKYGPKNLEALSLWVSVPAYFEGVGVLIRRKMIDIALVDDMLSSEILLLWEKIEPIVKEQRTRMNRPQLFEWFEYLYKQMKRREHKLSSADK